MIKKTLTIAILAMSLQSCATLSGSHPEKMAVVKNSFTIENNPLSEQVALNDTFSSDNQDINIGYLEKGRFDQLVDESAASEHNYSDAIAVVRGMAMAPLISVSDITRNSASILSSDKERNYYIPSYQITFLYAYQALNYLKQHRLEDAAVSIRNLSDSQDIKRKQEQFDRQKDNADKGTLSQVFNMSSLTRYIASSGDVESVNKLSQGLTNSYSNPLAYYVASIVYEAYDYNYNDALISMKNAKDAAPNNKYVKQSFKEFRHPLDGGSAYDIGKGRLTVIYEQGFVTPMSKCELAIPMTTSFISSAVLGVSIPAVKISLPCYKIDTNTQVMPSVSVKVYSKDKLVSDDKTSLLVNTTAMAAKSLLEDYPAIMTREALRVATKTIATVAAANAVRHSSDQYGDVASLGVTLLGSAYQYFTNVADNRSWLLLPNNVQLYVNNLPEGIYNIDVAGIKENVVIENGKNTLVWISAASKYSTTQFNNVLTK